MKRALLLDLDNTLIDRDAAFREWLESQRPRIPSLDVESMIALDRGGHGDRRALFMALGVALGVSPARARATHREQLPRFVTLSHDAAAMLDAFPGRKIVVTNGTASLQRAKLRAAGLERRVDGVIVSGELGRKKPDPACFLAALSLAGVAPHDALMIGDHPAHDIAGARAVGIDAWMLRTRWFDVPIGVRAIASLVEVCA